MKGGFPEALSRDVMIQVVKKKSEFSCQLLRRCVRVTIRVPWFYYFIASVSRGVFFSNGGDSVFFGMPTSRIGFCFTISCAETASTGINSRLFRRNSYPPERRRPISKISLCKFNSTQNLAVLKLVLVLVRTACIYTAPPPTWMRIRLPSRSRLAPPARTQLQVNAAGVASMLPARRLGGGSDNGDGAGARPVTPLLPTFRTGPVSESRLTRGQGKGKKAAQLFHPVFHRL